jgi:hypothetical protein
LVRKAHDRAAEEEPRGEPGRYVGHGSSPRAIPDPADSHAQTGVLECLEKGDEQYGGSVGAGLGDLQGLDRSLVEAAGDTKARGAAMSPRSPIKGARAFETAVPRASPTQTKVDHETCFTRSAAANSRPGKIPRPAAKSKSRISMTKPRRIASHAARKSVTLSPTTEGLVGVASVPPCDSLTDDPTIL